ncbi:unnamed protein product, partial [Mesorhabditis belari]|uniref:Uncharacterized protein n=1 Tax=Mesorhabditis belari TaxID=2138241 RepID=A0AAF3EAL2_9BILA
MPRAHQLLHFPAENSVYSCPFNIVQSHTRMIESIVLLSSLALGATAYYSCPGGMSGMLGMGGGAGYYGRPCGQESIFHHYRCCDYNQYECCIELETWFIIFLIIFGIGLLICCCLCIGGAIFGFQRANN